MVGRKVEKKEFFSQGTFGSDTFLSKAGWEAMHDGATKAPLIFGAEFKFTQVI